MNFSYGGKGGKVLRDTQLSDDSVGDDDVPGMMYESIAEGVRSVWSLTLPLVSDVAITKGRSGREGA